MLTKHINRSTVHVLQSQRRVGDFFYAVNIKSDISIIAQAYSINPQLGTLFDCDYITMSRVPGLTYLATRNTLLASFRHAPKHLGLAHIQGRCHNQIAIPKASARRDQLWESIREKGAPMTISLRIKVGTQVPPYLNIGYKWWSFSKKLIVSCLVPKDLCNSPGIVAKPQKTRDAFPSRL